MVLKWKMIYMYNLTVNIGSERKMVLHKEMKTFTFLSIPVQILAANNYWNFISVNMAVQCLFFQI